MSIASWVFLFVATIPSISFALGLGEPVGQIVIGQPLSIRIPLYGPDATTVEESCVRLLPSDINTFDRSVQSATIKVEKATIYIHSREAISEPILSFRIHLICGVNLRRDYHLLPGSPNASSEISPPEVSHPRDGHGTIAKPVNHPVTEFTVTTKTTLRLMSRERYPKDRNARVAFIREVAAANPGLFGNLQKAFDQPLTPGARLEMPERLSNRNVAGPSKSRTLIANLASSPSPTSRDRGRLIIGAGVPDLVSAKELNRDIDRLVGIMNEQIQIQIAMVQRIAKLEGEIADAKQAIVIQTEMNQRLETEIKELRDEQRRNSHVQLVLLIFLGGFALAAALLWRQQKRAPAGDRLVGSFSAPIAPATEVAAKQQRILSVFDDLLPQK